MNDPKLVRSSVTIRYTSDDGFSNEQTFKIHQTDAGLTPPEQPLLDALDELSRLTALFGFEEKALAMFTDARDRVAAWRIEHAATAKATGG